MNTVIPEFVKRVDFEKGPYYADVGNYGSAGSAHVEYVKTLPQNFAKVEGGMYGYGRVVFGASQKLGSGSLLYGGEAYYDNGPWVHPDAYAKFNGILTYSQGDDAEGVSITARSYHGKWNSSDQIPVSAVPLVGLYGTLDPTDGGHSQRYSLQSEWHRQDANSASKLMAYGFYYDLDLFSNFTYYLWTPFAATSSNSRTGAGWLGWMHATRFSAIGLAAGWEIRSACRSATIGSTTAFTRRKNACAWTKPITTPTTVFPRLCPRPGSGTALRTR